MSGRTRADDDPLAPPVAGGRPGPSEPPRLELVLVRYADRPDRCTVHPPEATGVERMSTWVSVDRSLVRDAAEMR